MHVVIRRYTIKPQDADEIVGLIRESFAPLISKSRGFVSYGVAQGSTSTTEIVTTSTFNDRTDSEASVKLAADWAREHLAKFALSPPQVTIGEVLIRHMKEHIPANFGVMRTYTGVSDVDEINRRVSANLLPSLLATPGLASFLLIDAGAGKGITMSTYSDRHAAESAGLRTMKWVKENLADLVPNAPEVLVGDIKLRIVQAGVLAR